MTRRRAFSFFRFVPKLHHGRRRKLRVRRYARHRELRGERRDGGAGFLFFALRNNHPVRAVAGHIERRDDHVFLLQQGFVLGQPGGDGVDVFRRAGHQKQPVVPTELRHQDVLPVVRHRDTQPPELLLPRDFLLRQVSVR